MTTQEREFQKAIHRTTEVDKKKELVAYFVTTEGNLTMASLNHPWTEWDKNQRKKKGNLQLNTSLYKTQGNELSS